MKHTVPKAIFSYLLLLMVATFLLQEDAQAQLPPEDVAKIRQVGQVELNYRGSHAAYILTIPRTEDEPIGGDHQELRIMDLESGEVSGLIETNKQPTAPSWMPGINRLAFLMIDNQHHVNRQVYSVNTAGEDLKKHTSAPEGVMAFAFSQDTSQIAYTMREPLTDDVRERHEKGYDMVVSGENERYVRLWIRENGDARAVSPDNMSAWDFVWSPDTDHLAVRLSYGTGLDDEMMFSEILKVNIWQNSMDLLVESQGKVGPMTWSPDGSQFAFLAAKSINDPLPQRIYITEVGSYTASDITPDNYEGTPEWLGWKDNQTLRFVAVEGTRTTLRELSVSGGDAQLLVGGGREIFRSASFDDASDRMATAVHRRDHPSELYVLVGPGAQSNWVRMTNHNTFLDGRTLGRQDTISWEGPDGLRIEGVITYPVDYNERSTYPLAVLPHGGPEGISIDGWNTRPLYPAQVLATHGYVVLKPNYRGSGGRGSGFAMANHRDLGGKEFEDVLRGIDHLVYDGIVHPGQVGISGTSYGGYFSAWAGTRYSDRFAAAITFAGLSNWISFMGTTDIPHEMSLTHWNLWWFENEGLNWDRSPVAHLQKARTPILVAHGLSDERVHPEQSMQLYQFLNLNYIPSSLVMYPRQPHGLTERAHRIDFMERVVNWFDQHVK